MNFAANRYTNMTYRRCGKSGLQLPLLSLGLWHNFGADFADSQSRRIICRAFDLGITHFDLANNYGPPPGAAEERLGKILQSELLGHRDELIVSTKAGYRMWPGPYGEWGSRKYVLASLDQSLKRLGLPYVDIFYSHRYDPDTPLEETMGALATAVDSGRALYVGISNYGVEETRKAKQILTGMGVPCIIHQPKYNMLNRWVENGLLELLNREGMGCIAFSPLAQGLLTGRYLQGIPNDSRAANSSPFLNSANITPAIIQGLKALSKISEARGQSLAQLSLSWLLSHQEVTSVLIGASSPEQVEDCCCAIKNLDFSLEELQQIDEILSTMI